MNKRLPRLLAAAGTTAIFTLWLLFVIRLWNQASVGVLWFPKIGYLDSFTARFSGGTGSFKAYIISAGLPMAAFWLLVQLPDVLHRLFPRYRLWNRPYVIAVTVVLTLEVLLMLCCARWFQNLPVFGTAVFRLQALGTYYVHSLPVTFFLCILTALLSLAERLIRQTPTLRSIGRGAAACVLCAVIAVITSISSLLLLNILNEFSSAAVVRVYSSCRSNAAYSMLAFVSLVCAPIMEEVTFRGLICGRLGKVMPRWGAILLSALFFGLWHRNLGQFVYTFLWGILYGWLYLSTGKLSHTILLHFLSNLIAILAHSDRQTSVFGAWLPLSALREWLLELSPAVSVLALAVLTVAMVFFLRRIRLLQKSKTL